MHGKLCLRAWYDVLLLEGCDPLTQNTLLKKLASVCSVALKSLNEDLYSRLKLLLSDISPVSDPLVQEAALKSATVLVRK